MQFKRLAGPAYTWIDGIGLFGFVMSLDLRALEHFVEINRHGGFARAARHLNVSQPTLSRSIVQLEEQFGVKLFERGVRGTRATSAGLRLLPRANAILAEIGRAQSLFDIDETEPREKVRFGISPSLAHPPYSSVIGQIIAENGNLNVMVETGTMENLVQSVRAGDLDVAVCLVAAYLTHDPAKFEGVSFEELQTEAIVPVARCGHPVFDGPVSLESVCAFDWAVPFQMSVSYRFETAFFRRNLSIPNQRLNCASMSLLREAVVDWGLLGMFTGEMVRRDEGAGLIQVIDLPDLKFPYSFALITAKIPASSSATQAVVAATRKFVADR